jgi:hypothetical protein
MRLRTRVTVIVPRVAEPSRVQRATDGGTDAGRPARRGESGRVAGSARARARQLTS